MADPAVLTPAEDGQRLDAFLAKSLPDLSRTRIQRLIADGRVTVDAKRVRPSHRLAAGQTVAVALPEPVSDALKPQPARLPVVHEDDDLVVIDKPPGLTVHPAAGQADGTLANALLALYPEVEGVGGPGRAGIVHRLDKGTSGLLVAAKNETSHASLTAQFKDRLVSKRYVALVVGAPSEARAVIEAPLGRHPRQRQRMAVVQDGRPSATPYRVLERHRGYTLVEASPKTGRTHQVRVHFASIGHPLAGDPTYGRREPGLDRQFLHAAFLAFRHPRSGETVEFRSELPPDLRRFLQSLEPRAPGATVQN